MIQRIQSLFLLCTAIVSGLMFFVPVASFIDSMPSAPDHRIYSVYTFMAVEAGSKPTFITWNGYSMALNVIITVLALITILVCMRKSGTAKSVLFLQLRLCVVNIVLQLGLLVLMWLQIRRWAENIGAEWTANIGFMFPVVGVIFTWLALRGIVKDIVLLKSSDRIR